ncbi:heme-degrading domain-containing protein [Umezawaea beigongshangensis]|uniref:heme-degrading domain-containing protein n=1 Tax=Umezawaea beigongshangensis TaxID=2780383 RepID=UPI0018F21D59|nr:heme-degrading domain-containing protein [Umezawaea beigongshangensis]
MSTDDTDHRVLLAELAEQEERLQFTEFDNDTAIYLGLHLLTAARSRGLPLTISVRRNGHRLFHASLPGTSPDNDEWIERKSRVVDRFGQSSFRTGTHFRARGTTFEESSRLDPDRYAAHGGVFPVIVRGVGPIGTVGVSGLPQAEDHAFVVEQLAEFLSTRS